MVGHSLRWLYFVAFTAGTFKQFQFDHNLDLPDSDRDIIMDSLGRIPFGATRKSGFASLNLRYSMYMNPKFRIHPGRFDLPYDRRLLKGLG